MSTNNNVKEEVRKAYGKIAKTGSSCCSSSSCCGSADSAQDISRAVGYSDEDMSSVPDGANLGLGCGNPVAIASLKEGDVVLDLGSGAGFDAFIASGKVGTSGRIIGVDMTEEMIERARLNAKKGNYKNVEFRLGEIEKLPVEDDSVDAIISNCVINLSQDKEKVFKESFRVLKPCGKIFISDIVLLRALPKIIMSSLEAYVGCIAGASMKDDYLNYIKTAGFKKINIIDQTAFAFDTMLNDIIIKDIKGSDIKQEDLEKIGDSVVSIKIQAEKSEDI